MTERILLVEDDARLAAMVAEYLGDAGLRVTIAGGGEQALARLAREPFDAVVLDLMLPDLDGLEVCRRLRARSDLPVLMLTARGDAADRIVGLELGADDYLPKPFEPRELLARLRAILRRRVGGAQRGEQLRYGRLEIDREPTEMATLGRVAGNIAAARGVTLYEVESTVEGDINLLGLLGISDEVRNGYEGIRVNFKIKGDAPAEKLEQIVEQSKNRSAVYDVITNGTPIEITVNAG